MSRKLVPVILAGGSGTRLWPISRASRPKQFLNLTGDKSLFQQTLLRVNDTKRYAAPIIVTNSEYRFLVSEQAMEVGVELSGVLLEPVARNTAPAILAAAYYAMGESKAPLLHILPSDHALDADETYWAGVDRARKAAKQGYFVTFGITPAGPATGYGYVEAGAEVAEGVNKVSRFVEKPDLANAEKMLADGGFYWNSGMFMVAASDMIEECAALDPAVADAAKAAVSKSVMDLDFVRLDKKAFEKSPSISIDYAIFERTKKGAIVPFSISWSDLGSWDAVWKAGQRDNNGNMVHGPVTLDHTSESLVYTEKAHVVVQGLDDVAVLSTDDTVYVGRLSSAQNVGDIVKKLRADAKTTSLTETHTTSYRPWGGYTSVLAGERFQVKRLFVKPGKSLSLQTHNHRSEHWVVVRGTAEVQVGDSKKRLAENESIYIPLGAKHRLTNPGKIQLELIEVQTGSYLGEDDIVRYDDEFGRT